MARSYEKIDFKKQLAEERGRRVRSILKGFALVLFAVATPLCARFHPWLFFVFALIPSYMMFELFVKDARAYWVEKNRQEESQKRGGKPVLGAPPDRGCFDQALADAQKRGKKMIDKYLVGFNLDTGDPLWVDEDDLCSHACVFAKTGVGKTLFLESLIFQQMLRGRASGCTFIDAKRDSGTLAQVILMALVTGRIEDLIVVDPFDPVHSYNFLATNQRADVKARKVLRAGLPPISDASTAKHYDRLAGDSIARLVRALESLGLSWNIHDMAVAMSAFQLSYPHIKTMLQNIDAKQALIELGHLASSYRSPKGTLDAAKLTENLRGISSELHAISGSAMGEIFCTNYTDLALTDAMLRGKIIYFMLPRLEEAESAARMVKIFREDLEISIGEITSSRTHHLEDPHLVVIDEGSSTFGPTWANLFELARKGRFALLFGAQSTGGLTDDSLGLSESFYERVMANVNLKVMMRVGDNRTAQDMAEWFGKVHTTKASIGAGVSSGVSGGLVKSPMDLGARHTGGETQTISFSEDEEYLVSPEELKHEMSAEKGLAWFDRGDGKIIKGRSFWFNAELPDTWEGREYLTRFERNELDPIGLGDWVDNQVLMAEKRDIPFENKESTAPTKYERKEPSTSKVQNNTFEEKQAGEVKPDDSPFKLDTTKNTAYRGTVRTFDLKAQESESESNSKVKEKDPKEKKEGKKEEKGGKNDKGKGSSGSKVKSNFGLKR